MDTPPPIIRLDLIKFWPQKFAALQTFCDHFCNRAQDESYWLDLPDKRALSFWVPMEAATEDNGCMWFVPGSQDGGLLPHRPTRPGHHVLRYKLSIELNNYFCADFYY